LVGVFKELGAVAHCEFKAGKLSCGVFAERAKGYTLMAGHRTERNYMYS
jgi:hypothetical protein